MLNYVESFRPLGSDLSAEVDHQNYYGHLMFKLTGNPILCPAEPNRFSAVVDKITGGANVQMSNLADDAIAKIYIPSEARRVDAALPKNHVQAVFRSDFRLTTVNWYENRHKTSGVLTCFRVATGFCVCVGPLQSYYTCLPCKNICTIHMSYKDIYSIYMSFTYNHELYMLFKNT